MKPRLILLIVVIVFIHMAGGCGKDSTTKSDIPNAFKGRLSLVVLNNNDGSPTGVAGIPVAVTVVDAADPGPYTLDTVYTNECGVAYFMKTVGCARYDSQGKLVITVGEADTFTVFFADGEDITEIIDYDALGSISR